MSRPARWTWLVWAVGLAAMLGCGRRGEPVPSRLRLPGPPPEVRLAGPAGRLEVRWSPPRADLAGRPLPAPGAYQVFRAAWPAGEEACRGCPEPLEPVAVVEDATAWTDPDVEAGWTYRYRVRAGNGRGAWGPLSGPADIAWVPLAPPRAEAEPGDGRVVVRVAPAPWPPGVEPVGVRVYGPEGRLRAEGPPGGGALAVQGLENGRPVRLEVRAAARTPEGWTVESPGTVVSAVPRDRTPPAPPLALAAFQEPGGVRLVWAPAPGEPYAAIRVLRAGPEGGFREVARLPGTATGFTDRAVEPGRAYRYTVVAEDRAGNASLPAREVEIRWRGRPSP